jgi:hypothetical protein
MTGIYYPFGEPYHVAASVAVSLGFPLGYLILNSLTSKLMKHYNNHWPSVQLVYSGITLIAFIVCCPFFTQTYAEVNKSEMNGLCDHNCNHSNVQSIEHADFFLFNKKKVKKMIKIVWLLSLFFMSCANNVILVNLNGYFFSIGIAASNVSYLIVIGFSDIIFRVTLALLGRFLVNRLKFCYLFCSLIGILVSFLWPLQRTNSSLNFFYSICNYYNCEWVLFFLVLNLFFVILIIVFSFCPAGLMSLMYAVNSEITGSKNIDSNYTLNVMISGIGIVLGPTLSGS